MNRREFIKKTSAALGGAYLGFYAPRFLNMGPSANPSPNMQYRVLGKTGLKVSEVGFGGYPIRDPRVVQYAIDQGINYIDTARDYGVGPSERVIGKALKGRRSEVVLTTKWHPWSKTKVSEMMASLDTSLRELQTDYVDVLLVHEVGKASGGESIERLQNPELFKAIEIAKRQGKARYFGCSGHDGDLMEVMDYAMHIPEFSVLLCRYNFMAYPTEPAFIKKANEKGVAVIAMKTLAGARGEDLTGFRDQYTSYKQAALKWVLSNQDVGNLIISMSSKQQVDEYALASGRPMLQKEAHALNAYAATFGTQICRFCNGCESACPDQVPVAKIARYRMYEKEYKMTGEGKRLYGDIGPAHRADRCLGCDAPCQKECEYGVHVRKEMIAAHQILK